MCFCWLAPLAFAAERSVSTMDAATGEWRDAEDTIEGWDWSLPASVQPTPRSGLKFGGPNPPGYRGNRLVSVDWSWRQLEPEEGRFEFEPLRQAIRQAARQGDGIELHIKGSVWELRHFPSEANYPGNWKAHIESSATAPRWLAKYDIPLIEERKRGLDNIGTPFQVVNMDIYHPEYHTRYMRMLRAFGESGIPQMDEISVCMIHVMSGSRGEEGAGPESGAGAQAFEERLRAWAKAFQGAEHKLCYVANKGKHLELCYELGIGQRNGFVEHYLMHYQNPQLGQSLDEDGYLVVDEDCPPIAGNWAFGDENEEYSPGVHENRFGPIESWPHRYRESMLRALQMRRNLLWAESPPWVNIPLLNYVGLELGKNARTAPDAWCYLRESLAGQAGKPPVPIKNFERWLYQRDKPGFRAAPAAKVFVPSKMLVFHPDHYYDYTARTTSQAEGETRIGFALDDRFLSGGPSRVAIKVTYHDIGQARWALEMRGAGGELERAVQCGATGKIRTATFIVEDAMFANPGMDFDFVIRADEGDAVVSFVRVIKLP